MGHRVYLGKFRVGKLRLGRFSGGSEDSDVVPDNPLKSLKQKNPKTKFISSKKRRTYVVVVIDVVDGKLSDGNERGGIVGTDNGGNPNDRIIFKIF